MQVTGQRARGISAAGADGAVKHSLGTYRSYAHSQRVIKDFQIPSLVPMELNSYTVWELLINGRRVADIASFAHAGRELHIF